MSDLAATLVPPSSFGSFSTVLSLRLARGIGERRGGPFSCPTGARVATEDQELQAGHWLRSEIDFQRLLPGNDPRSKVKNHFGHFTG